MHNFVDIIREILTYKKNFFNSFIYHKIMEERIKMNTESLQQNFKADYEEFFAKNDLVVSGCLSFSRGTMDIGHRSQHLRIKSKLPIKMYV